MQEDNFKVTPWEVTGKVDYERLIQQFGTQKISNEILNDISTISKGKMHVMLRRNIFFSHRDLDLILKDYREGKGFFLYTGRAPSLGMHIGHLVPFLFTKWLQDIFDVNVYIEITDDEKFMRNQEYTLKQTSEWAYQNILDIIAVGFNPDKTFIFKDTEYIRNMYPLVTSIAKRLNFSQIKATFGLDSSSNIGILFYPAIQIVPTMFEKSRCLIPAAIDQDPYWRLQRDLAESLGYHKAAEIHSKFLPPLASSGGKMSSSIPESAVYLSDPPKTVEKKIMKYAFSGGQATTELQRKLGADLNVDVPYQWLYYIFEEDDDEIKRIADEYSAGRMLTGEIKKILAQKVNELLEEHRRKREASERDYDKFLYEGRLAKHMWQKIHS
ncbi:MAG: tryptophan--tRNA ligase [Candidatus Thermoplasmatota archaeon]|nr:tryptophan--tRNA ligase [Candidatus Thermoplasmatota archaeon]MCL5789388.1 tryptophan--tRNA ligase [Candidatus Thermoplasmatota archaeon]